MRTQIIGSARKRGVGNATIEYVMTNATTIETILGGRDPKIVWIGPDPKGIETKIVAVVLPGKLMIIHAQWTERGRRN